MSKHLTHANGHTVGPSWIGQVESLDDALRIVKAARIGLIPRAVRRLSREERSRIFPGSVFVYEEEESGIKRWTDDISWSPSRIRYPFLLYRSSNMTTIGHVSGLASSESGPACETGSPKMVSPWTP